MTDTGIFSTDTAAELLEAQGYRAHAAEVYIFLIKKFPEKKAYYIEKLEALQEDLVWARKNGHIADLLYEWLTLVSGKNKPDCLINARNRLIERKKTYAAEKTRC